MRGIERRVAEGLDPNVGSVASLFVSRWDVAVGADERPRRAPEPARLAAAIAGYVAYRELLESDRWLRLENEGARPQRFLFASTGTKDPSLPKTKYVRRARGAALGRHDARGHPAGARRGRTRSTSTLAADGGDNDELLAEFERAGIDLAGARACGCRTRAPRSS